MVLPVGNLQAQVELPQVSKTIILDTIYANDTKNVALFFPDPIKQGITGSVNFVFTYNREKEQHFGLLQASPGEESNLLIINRNGAVFSYIVRYKKQLSKLNYFIPGTQSIGNEKPVLENTEPKDSIGEKAKKGISIIKSLVNICRTEIKK